MTFGTMYQYRKQWERDCLEKQIAKAKRAADEKRVQVACDLVWDTLKDDDLYWEWFDRALTDQMTADEIVAVATAEYQRLIQEGTK